MTERIKTFANQPLVNRLLVDLRRNDQGGESFRADLRELARLIGNDWAQEHLSFSLRGRAGPFGAVLRLEAEDPPVIVTIPRGGVPLGQGLRELFPEAPYFQTNAGRNQRKDEPLLSDDFPQGEIANVVIADAVVGTGETVGGTIRAIKARARVEHFTLVAAVASGRGSQRLLAAHPDLEIQAGCLEHRFKWVGPVFFVYGIGDVGELVSR